MGVNYSCGGFGVDKGNQFWASSQLFPGYELMFSFPFPLARGMREGCCAPLKPSPFLPLPTGEGDTLIRRIEPRIFFVTMLHSDVESA
jgi:hypothetical protein